MTLHGSATWKPLHGDVLDRLSSALRVPSPRKTWFEGELKEAFSIYEWAARQAPADRPSRERCEQARKRAAAMRKASSGLQLALKQLTAADYAIMRMDDLVEGAPEPALMAELDKLAPPPQGAMDNRFLANLERLPPKKRVRHPAIYARLWVVREIENLDSLQQRMKVIETASLAATGALSKASRRQGAPPIGERADPVRNAIDGLYTSACWLGRRGGGAVTVDKNLETGTLVDFEAILRPHLSKGAARNARQLQKLASLPNANPQDD